MQHTKILFTIVVLFIAYTAIIYTHGTEAPTSQIPFSSEAQRGMKLWNKHNCIACHQIYGLGGYMGPDLTNVISKRGPAYAKVFLQAGTQRMPNFNLKESEINDLISYLTFLDSSGISPDTNYRVTWYGTVERN